MPLFFCFSCRAMITISRKCSDELMFSASVRVVPDAPLLPTRSEPARSTRCSLDLRTVVAPCGRLSTLMVKMQWEREECAFIVVSDTARFVSPKKSRLIAASSLGTTCDESPLSRTEPSSSSETPCTRASSPSPAEPPEVPAPPSECWRPLACDPCFGSSRSKPLSL